MQCSRIDICILARSNFLSEVCMMPKSDERKIRGLGIILRGIAAPGLRRESVRPCRGERSWGHRRRSLCTRIVSPTFSISSPSLWPTVPPRYIPQHKYARLSPFARFPHLSLSALSFLGNPGGLPCRSESCVDTLYELHWWYVDGTRDRGLLWLHR